MTGRWTLPLALGSALAFVGCQSPPEVDVAGQWADATRRLNMFGFYPQSEDVQVSDLFLHAPPPDGSPSLPRFNLLRVASFHPDHVLNELQGQQGRRGRHLDRGGEAGDRLTIQPLPTKEAAGTITKTPDCGGYDIGHADEAGCMVRMQRAAMPGLSAGRVTIGQLGAAGTFGNFGARLGLGNSSQTAVALSFRNLQDLSLDAWRVSRLREQHEDQLMRLLRAERVLPYLGELRADLLADACNGNARRLANAKIELMVINRMVYAGGVEYSFNRNAETAIRAAVDLQSLLPGQPQAPVIPALAAAPGAPGAPPTTADASGQRLAALLQGITGESGSAARAGVTASLGIGSFGALSLKQDFNRLIAVGAGSRVRYSFYDVLAAGRNLPAPEGPGSLAEYRFRKASDYCSQALPGGFDRTGLRRAMRLPEAG